MSENTFSNVPAHMYRKKKKDKQNFAAITKTRLFKYIEIFTTKNLQVFR